jgi:hypothetical protein
MARKNVAMAKRDNNALQELLQQQANIFMVRDHNNRNDDPDGSNGTNEYRTGIKPDAKRVHSDTSFFQSGQLAVCLYKEHMAVDNNEAWTGISRRRQDDTDRGRSKAAQRGAAHAGGKETASGV